MNLLHVVILNAFLLATAGGAKHGKAQKHRQTRPRGHKSKRGRSALYMDEVEITHSDDDQAVSTPPFLMAIFETNGVISDAATAKVEKATDAFVLAELNAMYAPTHKINYISTIISNQKEDRYDSRSLEGRKLTPLERIEIRIASGARDTSRDEKMLLRGQRRLDMLGTELEMQINATFDRQPAPSEEDIDNALKEIMKELSSYVSNITASNHAELQDVQFAFRREIPTPTDMPTSTPSQEPTTVPTNQPTPIPTGPPTKLPTKLPTMSPTTMPSQVPTSKPTTTPTNTPTTASPTGTPTGMPTLTPTAAATASSGVSTTSKPTRMPTATPTQMPTWKPSRAPTRAPTSTPTGSPTQEPTQKPTRPPTRMPTSNPTEVPTMAPTDSPTRKPTKEPTRAPTSIPTGSPTEQPTQKPTRPPTRVPTSNPTEVPTMAPTDSPTPKPTKEPTRAPTSIPTGSPTEPPTQKPTRTPTTMPTSVPTTESPFVGPAASPTPNPARIPTGAPTVTPTSSPTQAPTSTETGATPTGPQTSIPTAISDSANVYPTQGTYASPSPSMAPFAALSETPSLAAEVIAGAYPWGQNEPGSDRGPADMLDETGKVITRTTTPDQAAASNNTALIASVVCVSAAFVGFMGFLLYRRRQRDTESQRADLIVVESDLDSIDPSMMSPSTNNENIDSLFGGLDSGSLESPHLAKTKSMSSATTVRATNILAMTPKSQGGSLFAFSEEDSVANEEESVEVTSIDAANGTSVIRYTPSNSEAEVQDHLVDTGSEAPSRPDSPVSYSKLMQTEEDDWKPTGVAAVVAGVMGATVGAVVGGSRRQKTMEEDGSFPQMNEGEHSNRRQHAGYQGEGDGTMVYQTAAAAVNPLDVSKGSNSSEHEASFCGSLRQQCQDSTNKVDQGTPTSVSTMSATGTPRSAVSSLSGSIGTDASKDTAASSQFSASRQLINDLVWLEKKIADVKTTGDVATTIKSDESQGHADSLSSISKSTTGKSAGPVVERREVRAPPGKLQVVIHTSLDGPAVHDVREGSPLTGELFPGDIIVAIDGDDTRAMGADKVMKIMAERSSRERSLSVLHYTGE